MKNFIVSTFCGLILLAVSLALLDLRESEIINALKNGEDIGYQIGFEAGTNYMTPPHWRYWTNTPPEDTTNTRFVHWQGD